MDIKNPFPRGRSHRVPLECSSGQIRGLLSFSRLSSFVWVRLQRVNETPAKAHGRAQLTLSIPKTTSLGGAAWIPPQVCKAGAIHCVRQSAVCFDRPLALANHQMCGSNRFQKRTSERPARSCRRVVGFHRLHNLTSSPLCPLFHHQLPFSALHRDKETLLWIQVSFGMLKLAESA